MAVTKTLRDYLEDNVLTLLCWDEQHAPTIAMQVTADLFSTRNYQKLAKIALDHLAKYGIPPKQHIRDYLEAELRREEGRHLRDIIGAMEGLAPTLQIPMVQDDLDLFIARRKMAM